MPTPALALRRAIRDRLAASPALTALIGAGRVHDEPPLSAKPPYVLIGEARVTDWSTATEPGAELNLTLDAFSRQGGHSEAHALAGVLLEALDDAPLTLDGHRLVALRFGEADIRRDRDGRTYRAALRFRALTEPL
jgi:hypothetical protein